MLGTPACLHTDSGIRIGFAQTDDHCTQTSWASAGPEIAFLLIYTPCGSDWPNLNESHPKLPASMSSSSAIPSPTLLRPIVRVPFCPCKDISAEIDDASPRYRDMEYE